MEKPQWKLCSLHLCTSKPDTLKDLLSNSFKILGMHNKSNQTYFT